MKSRHFSKVIDVFQRTCSCLLDTWKKKYKVPITSFFALSNLLTQTCLHFRIDMAAHLFWTCKMHIAYVVYYCICFPLCAHILYFARWTETEQTERERERDVCACWTETEQTEREREVCACWESKTSHGSTADSQRLNKVWALFLGKKVA